MPGRVSEFQISQGAHWKRFSHHHISSYHTRSTYITTALSRSLVKSARTYLASALKKSMCQMFCNEDTVFVNRLRNPSFLVYLYVTCCARTRPWGNPLFPYHLGSLRLTILKKTSRGFAPKFMKNEWNKWKIHFYEMKGI